MAEGKGHSNVGTCVAVATGHPATFDAAGFVALTWVAWEEMTEISGGGVTRNVESYTPACSGNEHKVTGGRSRSDLSIKGADVAADPAQVVMKTAESSVTGNISVRETLPTGDIVYHYGILSGMEPDGRSSTGVRMLGATVACSGVPVEVAA